MLTQADLLAIEKLIDKSFEKNFDKKFDEKFEPAFNKAFEKAFTLAFVKTFSEVWEFNLQPAFQDIENRFDKLEQRVDSLESKVANLPTKEYLDEKIAKAVISVRAPLTNEDKKVNRFIDITQYRKSITDNDADELKGMPVFGK